MKYVIIRYCYAGSWIETDGSLKPILFENRDDAQKNADMRNDNCWWSTLRFKVGEYKEEEIND